MCFCNEKKNKIYLMSKYVVKIHEKRRCNCVKITMKLLLTIQTFGAIIKHIKAQ